MTEISLPQRILTGSVSAEKVLINNYQNILICSDSNSNEISNFIMTLKQQSIKMITQAKTIVNLNIDELTDSIISFVELENTDLIIAVGSSELISAVGRISTEFKCEFSAVPSCAFFSTDKMFKMPAEVILDENYIISSQAQTIAYDAMAAFALVSDSLVSSQHEYIKKFAQDNISDILKYIVPAFRGEISARKKLFLSMFFSQMIYMNCSSSISLLREICNFFSDFGYPEKSVASVCIPNILECMDIQDNEVFAQITRQNRYALYGDSDRIAIEKLIEKIRNIQALIGIPRNIRFFGIEEEKYKQKADKSDIDRKLLDLCYYGSFKFMKL